MFAIFTMYDSVEMNIFPCQELSTHCILDRFFWQDTETQDNMQMYYNIYIHIYPNEINDRPT